MPEAWDQLGELVLASLKSLREDIKALEGKFDHFVSENSKDARDLALKTGRLEDRMTRLETNTSQSSGAKTTVIASIIATVAGALIVFLMFKGLGLK